MLFLQGFCGNNKPEWKREIVSDHKFENVNLNAFHDSSCTSRFGHMFVFIATIKSACVCLADLYTAGMLYWQIFPELLVIYSQNYSFTSGYRTDVSYTCYPN